MNTDILTSADVINRHLGARLRQLRQQQRLSLQACADILDVAYQQIQKYETGANRLSAASLVRLARAFGVTPASFFDGLEPALSSGDADATAPSSQKQDPWPGSPDRELVQSMAHLSPLLHHRLHELMLAIEQSQTPR